MGKRRVSGIYVEVSALTKGLEGGLIRAEQLCKRSSGRMDKAINQIKFSGVIQQVDSLGKAFGALQSAVAGLAIGYAAKSIFDAGVQAEKLDIAFKSITGSTAAAQQEMDFLRGVAGRLGGEFYTLAESYKGIVAAAKGTALEGKAVRDIFESIMSAGVALGASNDQLNRTFLQIGQGIGRTKFELEDLKTIAEALPGVGMGDFAASLGVTTQEFFKMVTAGKVVSEDFLPKLAVSLKDKFGSAAVEASDSAQAALNRFLTAWMDLKTEIAKSGALDAMSDGLKALTGFLEENRAEVTAFAEDTVRLAKVLGSVGGIVMDVISRAASGWEKMPDSIKTAGVVGAIAFGVYGKVAITAFSAFLAALDYALEKTRGFGMPERFKRDVSDLAHEFNATGGEIYKAKQRLAEYIAEKEKISKTGSGVERLPILDFNIDNATRNIKHLEDKYEDLRTRIKGVKAEAASGGETSPFGNDPFKAASAGADGLSKTIEDAQKATEKLYSLIGQDSDMAIMQKVANRRKEIEAVIAAGVANPQQIKAMYDELDAYQRDLKEKQAEHEQKLVEKNLASISDMMGEAQESSIKDHEDAIEEWKKSIGGYYDLIDDKSDESIEHQTKMYEDMIASIIESSKQLEAVGMSGLTPEQIDKLRQAVERFKMDAKKAKAETEFADWKGQTLKSDDFFGGVGVALEEMKRNSTTTAEISSAAFLNAFESIEDGIADTFSGIFQGQIDGFEDMADKLKNIFFDMLGQMAAKAAVTKLMPSADTMSAALPALGALGAGTIGASGVEESLALQKGSISKLPVGAGAVASSFFATDVALQKLFGANESRFEFIGRELNYNESVGQEPLSKPNAANQAVLDAIDAMQASIREQIGAIMADIPAQYAAAIESDLSGLSIRFSGWKETKNKDFQKDVEARIAEMAEEMQQQVEPVLLGALDSMKADFFASFGGALGASAGSTIDAAYSTGGLGGASTAIDALVGVLDQLDMAIDPDKAQTLTYQIEQINKKYDEQAATAEKLGISTDLVSQAQEAETDRLKKSFAEQKQAMEDALNMSIDPAMADGLQYQIDQINKKYAEQTKQAEILGVSMDLIAKARGAEIDALKSADVERQRIEAERLEAERKSIEMAEAERMAKEAANRADISSIFGDIAYSISDLKGEMTDLDKEIYQVNKQYDDYIKQLESLGATQEDLTQLEALRAENLKYLGQVQRDSAGIGAVFSGIDYNIGVVSGALSELDQSVYQVDQAFAGYAEQLRAMGATASELERLEAKRVQTIEAEQGAIRRANEESARRESLARLEAENAGLQGLMSQIEGDLQDRQRQDWGLAEYQAELERLNSEMQSLNDNSSEYNIQLLDYAERQYNVLQNIDRLQLEQKNALDDLVKAAASIINEITDMRQDYLTSDYAPVQSQTAYEQRYQGYLATIGGPDSTIEQRIAAAEEFADYLPEFLSFMQGISGDYASIFAQAMEDLAAVQGFIGSSAVADGLGGDLVDQVMPDFSSFISVLEGFTWGDYVEGITWETFVSKIDEDQWAALIGSPDWAEFERRMPDLSNLVGAAGVDWGNYFFATFDWYDVLSALMPKDADAVWTRLVQLFPDFKQYSGWQEAIETPDWERFMVGMPNAESLFGNESIIPSIDWHDYIDKIKEQGGDLTWGNFLANVTEEDWKKIIESPAWGDLEPTLPDWSTLAPSISGLDFNFAGPDWDLIIDKIKKSGAAYSWSDFISDLSSDQWQQLITSPEWSQYLQANGLDPDTFTSILDELRTTAVATDKTSASVGGSSVTTVGLLEKIAEKLGAQIDANTISVGFGGIAGEQESVTASALSNATRYDYSGSSILSSLSNTLAAAGEDTDAVKGAVSTALSAAQNTGSGSAQIGNMSYWLNIAKQDGGGYALAVSSTPSYDFSGSAAYGADQQQASQQAAGVISLRSNYLTSDIRSALAADTGYGEYLTKYADYAPMINDSAINDAMIGEMTSGRGVLSSFQDEVGNPHEVYLEGGQIKYYAAGGYTDRPAIFGDAGGEWAVPAFGTRNNANFLRSVGIDDILGQASPEKIAAALAAQQTGGKQLTVTVPVILDGREIGKAVSRQIDLQPELKRQISRI